MGLNITTFGSSKPLSLTFFYPNKTIISPPLSIWLRTLQFFSPFNSKLSLYEEFIDMLFPIWWLVDLAFFPHPIYIVYAFDMILDYAGPINAFLISNDKDLA